MGLKRDSKGRFIKGCGKFTFNKEELIDLYWNKKLSTGKIAKLKGCSRSYIINKLNEFNILTRKIKHDCLKGKLNEIMDLYLNKKMSCPEIGKIYSVSGVAIRMFMKRNGVKIRTIGIDNIGKNKTFTKEHINHMNKWRIGIPRQLETRKKISATHLGINLEEWDKFTKTELYSTNWITSFKNKIRKRDNQVCMVCGIHREKLNEALHVHHVNYDKKLSVPDNLICLCRRCHTETNFNRTHWTKFFQSLLSERYGYQYNEDGKIILNIMDVKND